MTMKTLLLTVLLAGCVLPPSQADLATYNAVAPEYAAYVMADQALTPEAKQNRLDTVETWRIRVGAPAPGSSPTVPAPAPEVPK